jgi:hypothetical protein
VGPGCSLDVLDERKTNFLLQPEITPGRRCHSPRSLNLISHFGCNKKAVMLESRGYELYSDCLLCGEWVGGKDVRRCCRDCSSFRVVQVTSAEFGLRASSH